MTAACESRILISLLLAAGSLASARPLRGGPSTLTGAAAEGGAVTATPALLEWKATKEEGVYGYLVYRSTDRNGPYYRLGHEIVHVSPEPGEIHSYRFADPTVEPGKTYYYYLDTIATTGVKSRFSGVVAKLIPPP